jgi:hypothetical protein
MKPLLDSRNFTKYFAPDFGLTSHSFRRRVLLPREKIATVAALPQGAHCAIA